MRQNIIWVSVSIEEKLIGCAETKNNVNGKKNLRESKNSVEGKNSWFYGEKYFGRLHITSLYANNCMYMQLRAYAKGGFKGSNVC